MDDEQDTPDNPWPWAPPNTGLDNEVPRGLTSVCCECRAPILDPDELVHHDGRALHRACLERRRYVLDPKWRSRKVQREDLAKFEVLLALDQDVLDELRRIFPEAPPHRLRLLLDHVPGLAGQDVPDPYYSSAQGFEHALDLIERAVGSFRL